MTKLIFQYECLFYNLIKNMITIYIESQFVYFIILITILYINNKRNGNGQKDMAYKQSRYFFCVKLNFCKAVFQESLFFNF